MSQSPGKTQWVMLVLVALHVPVGTHCKSPFLTSLGASRGFGSPSPWFTGHSQLASKAFADLQSSPWASFQIYSWDLMHWLGSLSCHLPGPSRKFHLK